jgi:hypothetical protein
MLKERLAVRQEFVPHLVCGLGFEGFLIGIRLGSLWHRFFFLREGVWLRIRLAWHFVV